MDGWLAFHANFHLAETAAAFDLATDAAGHQPDSTLGRLGLSKAEFYVTCQINFLLWPFENHRQVKKDIGRDHGQCASQDGRAVQHGVEGNAVGGVVRQAGQGVSAGWLG
jgi:hypothetical protein